MENGQIGMKTKVALHSETDYTGVGLDRFYCNVQYVIGEKFSFLSSCQMSYYDSLLQ